MGKISQNKRLKNYYKIYEQIYESPIISIYDISVNTGLSRNTVSKYLKEMYAKGIIHGPYIRMRPAPTYKEYVYLMNFADPWMAFRRLKRVPHVVYHAVTFGDWNTMVVTDRLLDFSELTGLENVVNQGMRYCSYTPKVQDRMWDESFQKVYEQLDRFMHIRSEYKNRRLTPLTWEEDEWNLFCAFNFMRKKVTPELWKINVSYETYVKWMKTLQTCCTTHTGFYPEGYKSCISYSFLFFTDHEKSVKSSFSLLPTTSFVMELDKQLLVFAHVTSSEVKRKLFCLIYDMELKRMIKRFRQAEVLFHSPYAPRRVKPVKLKT